MTQTEKDELMPLLRELLEEDRREKREGKAMYKRICEEYRAETERFARAEDSRTWTGFKIRESIGTLLRMVYGVKTTQTLPAEREAEIRGFFGDVLALMGQLGGTA